MTSDIIDRFLQMTVNSVNSSSPVISISGTRAIYCFATHLKDLKQPQLLASYLPSIVSGLLNMALQFSTEVLALILETIDNLATVDPQFMASVEEKISPLLIATFLKHHSDPSLISVCQDVLKTLARIFFVFFV